MFQKAIITGSIAFTCCVLWPNDMAPTVAVVLEQPVKLDLIVGLALGVWFTK